MVRRLRTAIEMGEAIHAADHEFFERPAFFLQFRVFSSFGMNEHMMIALVTHACPGNFEQSRGMKSNSFEMVLLLGAIVFWVTALLAAFLFVTIAVLGAKTKAFIPRQRFLPWRRSMTVIFR